MILIPCKQIPFNVVLKINRAKVFKDEAKGETQKLNSF